LDKLQKDLETSGGTPVQILAVNEAGYESSLNQMSALGDLPVLTDRANNAVWDSWDVTYRDVVILDGKNECYAVFNLTNTSIQDPDNYAELKALFEGARNGDPSPGCP